MAPAAIRALVDDLHGVKAKHAETVHVHENDDGATVSAERTRTRNGETIRCSLFFTLVLACSCGGRLSGEVGLTSGAEPSSGPPGDVGENGPPSGDASASPAGGSLGSSSGSSSGAVVSSSDSGAPVPAAYVYCDFICGLTPYLTSLGGLECPSAQVCSVTYEFGPPQYACCEVERGDCTPTTDTCKTCTIPQNDGSTCTLPADGISTCPGSACVCELNNVGLAKVKCP